MGAQRQLALLVLLALFALGETLLLGMLRRG